MKKNNTDIFEYSKKLSLIQIVLTILFLQFLILLWALLALAYRIEFVSTEFFAIGIMSFFWLIIVPLSVWFIAMYWKHFNYCSQQLLKTKNNEERTILKRIMWFPLVFSFYYKNYEKVQGL